MSFVRRLATWRAGAVVLLAAGCSEPPFAPGERRLLEQNERKWHDARPQNYSVEIRKSCFCPNALADFTRLEIHGDSVVAAHSLAPGTPDPPVQGWPTVDAMFGWLRDYAENEDDYVTDVRVRYDPAYGYPAEIHVTCSDNVADCGAQYFARNLQPMP